MTSLGDDGTARSPLAAPWPYLRPYGAFRAGCERLPPEIERHLIDSCTIDSGTQCAGPPLGRPSSYPSKASLPSQSLQSESESNDGLGTETTKNAAVKGSAHDPVFSGIRRENEMHLCDDHGFGGDSESPELGQKPPLTAGAERLDTYIGPRL